MSDLSASALCLRSAARMDEGDYPGALADAETALAQEPGRAEALLLAALALLEGERWREAGPILDRLPMDSADNLVARARFHHADGDREASLSDLGRALEIDPGHVEALARRAYQLAIFSGHQSEARLDALAAVELLASTVTALRTRAEASSVVLQDHEGAIADVTEAIRLAPRNAALLQSRAVYLMNAGRMAQAHADLDAALALAPDDPSPLIARAWLLARQSKDTDNALAELGRVLARKPDCAEAHLARADILCNAGRHEDAIAAYGEAARLQPGDVWPLLHRARLRAQQGRRSEARAEYDAAVAVAPRNPWSLEQRAHFSQKTGDHAAAVEDYSAALSLMRHRHEKASALDGRASSRQELGDLAGALADYRAAVEADPTRGDLLGICADLLKEMGDEEGARREREALEEHYEEQDDEQAAGWRALLENDPDDVEGLLARARYLAESAYEEAWYDVSRVLELDPDNADGWTERARLRAMRSDNANAIEDYTRALEIEPDNVLNLRDRGWLREQAGDLAGALADVEAGIACNDTLGIGDLDLWGLEERRATLRRALGLDPS